MIRISKKRKKELREIYENKIGVEYVKWIKKQPTYTPFEWVELKSNLR